MMKSISLPLLVIALVASLPSRAEEPDKLKDIVVGGEDWQPFVQGLGFADGLSCDPATGNIFFSEMKAKDPEKPGVYTLSPTGEKKKLFDGGFSGTRLSADGKTLYACGSKKLIAYALPDGPLTVIAENIGTNDLAVTREGRVYETGNGKMQITLIDAKTKEVKAADTGNVKYPNGIGLSPDQKTLLVSDNAGVNVWTFAIQPDGTLADRKAAMTMKCPEKTPEVSKGDGLAVDAAGRAYVTTALGVQIFAPSGELLGILPKPKTGPLISCTFGGKDLDYLYISCGDTIFRRKMQVKGVSFAGEK
jgi:enterochelin esterase family protein